MGLGEMLENLRALWNIRRHGCHVLAVGAEDPWPRFTYSIGIQRRTGAPELLITALRHPLAHSIIMQYCDRLRAGERFETDRLYPGFLGGGFEVMFRPVEKKHYADWLGWGRWLYGGDGFDCWQVIVPGTSGWWPWDADAPPDYLEGMPLLCADTAAPRGAAEGRIAAHGEG